jgi:hypothetical protein
MSNYSWKVKIWIPITLIFLLIHTVFWSIPAVEASFNDFPGPYFSNIIPAIGSIIRIIGILVGLYSMYLAWGPPARSYNEVKSNIFIAIFFEGVYYLTFIPTAVFLINEFSTLQGGLYGLFSLIIAPSLIILSIKIKSSQNTASTNVVRWMGVACIGYVTTLWITIIANWVDLILISGFSLVFDGTNYVSFLNSIITLSLSLTFTLIACIPIINRALITTSTRKRIILSLVLIGLYFSIYFIHVLGTSSLNTALLGDIWLIPLLGLGISLLKT